MAEKKETPEVEQIVPLVEEVQMDECGCIIKPLKDLITTKQPEAETAEETED